MSRRALTLLLASVLALGMTLASAVAKVPYVALRPGPTYDTLGEVGGVPVIQVSERQVFPTEGRLDLTTVSVRSTLTLAQAMTGWFQRDVAVVPRETVFPPDRSDEEVREDNQRAIAQSESSATVAALRQLGVPLTSEVLVQELAPDAPAAGALEAGDVLVSVDGRPVTDAAQLRELIATRDPGDPVTIGYRRGDAAPAEVVVRTGSAPNPDGTTRPVIGVVTSERADAPFDVTITLEDVGGPSAGLMFALGIVDKLEPESLTGGRYIAGTGEISSTGDVGPIGGIAQKIMAAEAQGVEAFLVPEANCPEAVGVAPDDLPLLKVTTLTDALAGLRALRDGGTPVLCPR